MLTSVVVCRSDVRQVMRPSNGGRGDGAGVVGTGLAMVQNLLDVASRRNIAASNAARQLHGQYHLPPLHLVVALVGPIGPVLLRECGGALRVRVCSDDRCDCEHSAHHLHGTTEGIDSRQQTARRVIPVVASSCKQ
jgi:hypothetical protein